MKIVKDLEEKPYKEHLMSLGYSAWRRGDSHKILSQTTASPQREVKGQTLIFFLSGPVTGPEGTA